MATYIMSDIHGCYDDLQNMLGKISFSASDQLILAGDYIDRGRQSYAMLKWIEEAPVNVHLLRGNHEEEFASNIELMLLLDEREGLESDLKSNEDGIALYESVKYFFKNKELDAMYFDFYGTIAELLVYYGVTLAKLCCWRELIGRMPYYYECKTGDRCCVAVHGGYAGKPEDLPAGYSSMEDYYLYARGESVFSGGVEHGMVIAGHTPTVIEGEFCFNRGNVFKYYDKTKDCIFYNIDCGCSMRKKYPDAKLSCIRIEDEKIFYV